MTNQDLLLPLLGTEATEVVAASAAAPSNEALVRRDDKDASASSPSCWDHLVTLGLGAVLLFQFAVVFLRNHIAFDGAQWTTVVVAVALYTVSTILYQMAALDAKVRSLLVILLPEITAVIIVALISFNYTALAFYILMNGVLTMALAVVIYSATELWRGPVVAAVEDEPIVQEV
jgi:hypothetical protein